MNIIVEGNNNKSFYLGSINIRLIKRAQQHKTSQRNVRWFRNQLNKVEQQHGSKVKARILKSIKETKNMFLGNGCSLLAKHADLRGILIELLVLMSFDPDSNNDIETLLNFIATTEYSTFISEAIARGGQFRLLRDISPIWWNHIRTSKGVLERKPNDRIFLERIWFHNAFNLQYAECVSRIHSSDFGTLAERKSQAMKDIMHAMERTLDGQNIARCIKHMLDNSSLYTDPGWLRTIMTMDTFEKEPFSALTTFDEIQLLKEKIIGNILLARPLPGLQKHTANSV